MGKMFCIAVSTLTVLASIVARAESPVTLRSQGWTISVNAEEGTISVAQENLGPVLQNVRLNLQGERGPEPLTGWSVEQATQSHLIIRCAHPVGAWILQLSLNALEISSTFSNAIITAEAPAPLSRIPARTLDPRGAPVVWMGTNEAMLEYGGVETQSPSFLPTKNPEVMYFGLGPVSGSAFHALFDRTRDTVIQFSDETMLRRSEVDDSRMTVSMPVRGNAVMRLIPDYYTKILGAPFFEPFDDSYFKTAPMVWSSWTGYYADVTEDDIVQNTDWLAKNLKPYGFQYVQLDDGFDRLSHGEHDWIENWSKTKFPHGPQWLTGYIKSKGLHAGLWLVPNVYAGFVSAHPDWYVHTNDGELVQDYLTSVLDSSNPQVLAFLKKMFTTLGDWGFEYYKFDGEGSIPQVMPELDRSKLYQPSADPVQVYRERTKVIRDTIGPHVFVEGCPAGMPLNATGYYNSFFNGNDLYDNWQGMYPLFSSINGNAFFNHMFAYVMPGEGLELGKPMTIEEARKVRRPGVIDEISNREIPITGVGVTDAEARTLVSFISLTGVAYPVGNVMLDLPADRLKLLQQTMPTMPILPLDLFSRGTDSRNTTFREQHADYYVHNYPEILDLKVAQPSEAYDVAGFINWRSEATKRKISLTEKLGLEPGKSHLAFDFWNQKFLGEFTDDLEMEIGAHDTRVLSIHPVLNRPQLLGNSRHITGAYSISNEQWDASKHILSGTSESVPGENYTLWFYLPQGTTLKNLSVGGKGNHTIAAQHSLQGDALMVSFPGQSEAVKWELSFAGSSARQ